ncbi:hypothetical protein EG829_07820 [bacterium]|nr:hypothetical protein [bacterium]
MMKRILIAVNVVLLVSSVPAIGQQEERARAISERCAEVSREAAAELVDSTLNDGKRSERLLNRIRKACEGVDLRQLGGNCAQTATSLDQYAECVANIAYSGGADISAAVTCGPLQNFICCQYVCTNTRTGAVFNAQWCRTPPNCPDPNTYSNCTCDLVGPAGGPPCNPHTCNDVGTRCD